MAKLPCLRYKVKDLVFYRDQSSPNPNWTKRWKSMDIDNITQWASEEIKTIEIGANNFGGRTYKVDVREFVPQEGDQLYEVWYHGGELKKYRMPAYALVDLDKATQARKEYVYNNFDLFFEANIDKPEPLFWNTYVMAFHHLKNAPVCILLSCNSRRLLTPAQQTEKERKLLENSFQLWTVHRMIATKRSGHILGSETLGTLPINDPNSSHYGGIPKPAVMSAQFQAVTYSRMLRPLNSVVLSQLHDLTIANKRTSLFTIYLTLFVLLHSCAMVTESDERYARKHLLKVSQQHRLPMACFAVICFDTLLTKAD
jgi:hypothetical protein